MAEPFKNLINAEVVRQMGHHLQRVSPPFDRLRFEALALHGLEGLEFKARAQHVALALQATLPEDFHAAADVLEASFKVLDAPRFDHDPDKDAQSPATDERGLAGWALWGVGEYIARQGMPHPRRALQALHALTQRFTAEFAIRPFIVAHPDLVYRTLADWVRDPSAHVRRLVSEGSRPRLPWGLRLKTLIADPSPTLPLLLALQDDPAEYVRRSVANHLNDIAKDHPQVVVAWLDAHLPGAPPPRRRLLRHACRNLIKQGHPEVMAAWGAGRPFEGRAVLTVSPSRVTLGEALTLHLDLEAANTQAQPLEIDYRIHYRKASGSLSPKTFKGSRVTLEPGASLQWSKRHALRPVTTRVHHPGQHLVDVQVNGQVLGSAAFDLVL